MNTILPNIKIADRDMEFIFCEINVRFHKNKIIKYLLQSDDKEIKEVVDYLKSDGISIFPYEYKKDYHIKDVCVKKDLKKGLLYVKNKENNIYFRRGYQSKFRVARYFNNIQIEQDKRSPHCYTSDKFYPDKDWVILDVGGAEGYFSMQYIQYAKKVFIFECNPEWIEALNETYEKYMDKVFIINRFVSDYTDDNHIMLDDFIKEYQLYSEKIFVKIDAEGSEELILRGADKMLQTNQEMRMSICTYHCQEHETMFKNIFKGWKIEMSDRYMLYYYDYYFREPYVRRGVLRAEKRRLL